MTRAAIKKQVDNYLPLLTDKQQSLVLEMIKSFLTIEEGTKRISRKQYNKELKNAVNRIENGYFVSHKDAINELSAW